MQHDAMRSWQVDVVCCVVLCLFVGFASEDKPGRAAVLPATSGGRLARNPGTQVVRKSCSVFSVFSGFGA